MIAKVKNLEYHSEVECLIKLETREAGKIVLTILRYIPVENIKNYFLGQEFNIDLGGA